jgi:predicted secreted protein
MDFTGGGAGKGKISLTAPEIAENGNTVPVSVHVDSAMAGDDLVNRSSSLPTATRTRQLPRSTSRK